MEKIVLNTLSIDKVQQVDENLVKIIGYGARFGMANGNGLRFDENCFTPFIEKAEESGMRPYFNYQHNAEKIIGGWDSITFDENGMLCEGHLNTDVAFVRDEVLPLVMSGDLKGLSTEGFIEDAEVLDDDTLLVKSFTTLGISLVSLPADFGATMSLNSLKERFAKKEDNNTEEVKASEVINFL